MASSGTLVSDFELVRRRPSPALAGIATDMAGYRETSGLASLQREPASLAVPLVIGLAGGFSIGFGGRAGDRHQSFAAGLVAGPVEIASVGDACCLQINFTPLGARRFFGLPQSELTARLVAPDLLLGARFKRLRERLGEASDWESRFDLLESFVLARLRDTEPVSPAVEFAYGRIAETGGRIRIARLASEIGWTRKHLATRFADQIGLTPKAVARIVRFERAAVLARGGSASGWADIAAECGFTDQPHLVDEFRALAGVTPTEWKALAA